MTADTSIRLVGVADAPVIAGHLRRDAADFARWEPPQPEEYYSTPGQVRRIESLLDAHGRGERWPWVILAGDAVVGQVTLSTIVRGSFRKGFLGYWVATTSQGQGHASRAVRQVVDVMRDGLGMHRAEAHTQLENLASQRVLRNSGFTPWGVAHAHIYVAGAWRDELFWERILTDDPPG
jgi:ribosomal-protein-alanine N-acetyltransferase